MLIIYVVGKDNTAFHFLGSPDAYLWHNDEVFCVCLFALVAYNEQQLEGLIHINMPLQVCISFMRWMVPLKLLNASFKRNILQYRQTKKDC